MGRFKDGLLRLLGVAPWSERRAAKRRSAEERRDSDRETPVIEDRRSRKRRGEDRRGRGWFRFWNPP